MSELRGPERGRYDGHALRHLPADARCWCETETSAVLYRRDWLLTHTRSGRLDFYGPEPVPPHWPGCLTRIPCTCFRPAAGGRYPMPECERHGTEIDWDAPPPEAAAEPEPAKPVTVMDMSFVQRWWRTGVAWLLVLAFISVSLSVHQAAPLHLIEIVIPFAWLAYTARWLWRYRVHR